MISDVLYEAILEIRRYRSAPEFSGCYDAPTTIARLDAVVNAMEETRQYLDAVPDVEDFDKTGDRS